MVSQKRLIMKKARKRAIDDNEELPVTRKLFYKKENHSRNTTRFKSTHESSVLGRSYDNGNNSTKSDDKKALLLMHLHEEREKRKNRSLQMMLKRRKKKVEYNEKNRYARFIQEHDVLVPVIIFMPLMLMSLYIIFVEKGDLFWTVQR